MDYMIYASILGIIFTYVCSKIAVYYESINNAVYTFLTIMWALSMTLSAIALIVVIVFSFEWKAAEVKASIVNREYKTNYTQEELFYASDVVDIVRELDRKRIELNGNIMKEK